MVYTREQEILLLEQAIKFIHTHIKNAPGSIYQQYINALNYLRWAKEQKEMMRTHTTTSGSRVQYFPIENTKEKKNNEVL